MLSWKPASTRPLVSSVSIRCDNTQHVRSGQIRISRHRSTNSGELGQQRAHDTNKVRIVTTRPDSTRSRRRCAFAAGTIGGGARFGVDLGGRAVEWSMPQSMSSTFQIFIKIRSFSHIHSVTVTYVIVMYCKRLLLDRVSIALQLISGFLFSCPFDFCLAWQHPAYLTHAPRTDYLQ